MATEQPKRLGVFSLAAIIVSSMIGGGAFSLPSDMARHASITAILSAWIITGIGMLALGRVFQLLAIKRPELTGGIYTYARKGFGPYIGFNSAWGYWLSAFIGNVAYAIMLFNALAYFFPVFGNGHNLLSIICASIIIWGTNFIAIRGIQQAAVINLISTIARLIPFFAFIVIAIFAFHFKNLHFHQQAQIGNGDFLSQVKSTMMVTVWIFIGIEGAVVLSGRAKSQHAVAKATLIGLLTTLFLYVILTFVTLACVPRQILLSFPTPSLAYALQYLVGTWGAWFINLGLIIALLGTMLAWLLLAAETPHIAAKDHTMPEFFARENKHGAPAAALLTTTIGIQVFLILAYISAGSYQDFYKFASVTILLPYCLSALFSLKIFFTSKKLLLPKIVSSIAFIYTLWLLYAAGIHLLIMTAPLFLIGSVIYLINCWHKKSFSFQFFDYCILAIFIVCSISLLFLKGGMHS